MKTEDTSFKSLLYTEAKKYSFELNENHLNMFEIYKDMLIEWNDKMNLTSIVDEYQVIVKHFIDCLECTKYIKEQKSIIDVGTGAGFPGLVIAIWFQGNANITLLDSLNKRLIFLEEVIKVLNLKNIEVVHGRAEDMANNINFREKYDYSVARAVASLNILCEYTSAYVKLNGKCILMKGDNLQDEVDKSKKALNTLKLSVSNIYKYNLKLDQNDEVEIYERSIIELKKNGNTPKNYPRSFAKIKKDPL